jgi:dipeptidyl aminopeptidase/acylaminoacyl peptidase
MPAVHNTEVWASKIVDWLVQRPDVDARRIGALGVSLGGYYCPRAVAFEPRFACGAVWGANHDWREVQQARLKREGENPVPHYWEHVLWVWGQPDIATFIDYAEGIHLEGVVEKIRCHLLITHGEKDRQIPLEMAHLSYDQAVNAASRTLRVFSPDEGATEHIGLDHLPHVGAYTADWIEDTLAALEAGSA